MMLALSSYIDLPGTTFKLAGETLTLTCTVTVADWAESLLGAVTLEWLNSENTTLSNGGNIILNDRMGSSPSFNRTLEFNPLQTSHGGQYTCKAMSDIGEITLVMANDVNVTVQSKFLNCYHSPMHDLN